MGMMKEARAWRVCAHIEAQTIDRFLVLPAGTPGKRGPRSLAFVFGLDRPAIAKHEKACFTDDRRGEILESVGLISEGGGGIG